MFIYRICTLSAYAETMNTTTIRHPSKWLRALRTYSHQAWGTALYYDGAGFRKSLQHRVRFGTEQAGVRSNLTVLQRPCLPSTISTCCHRRSLVSNRRLQKDWVCAACTTLRCGIISRRCRLSLVPADIRAVFFSHTPLQHGCPGKAYPKCH
jgi:hypothetical protein